MSVSHRCVAIPAAIRRSFLPVILVIVATGLSFAQQPNPDATKPAPPQSPSPIKIGGVTFSGSLRLRAENWGWFDTGGGFEDQYTFGAAVLRVALGQQREKFDWQVEGAFPALINLPEKAVAPAPQGQLGMGGSYFAANGHQDASAVLKQAFVRFKGLGGDKPSSLRIGRFEFSDGAETTPADGTLAALKRDHIAQRLIGPFGFSHIGRSFDGAQYVRAAKDWNFTLLAARPTEGVFQLRSLDELDVDFYYGALTKPLPGKGTQGEARVFALHYHDGRRALKTDNRSQAARLADTENIRLTTVGGNYIGAIKSGGGTFDLLLWGAGQFGDWGRLNHRAGAIAAEAGYQPAGRVVSEPGGKLKCWLRAGYFRSSGDGDPGDRDHTTFFTVLPTPRIYARFPFINQMNNEDIFGEIRLKPHSRLSLRVDVHHLRLSSDRDLWYVGGGAFQKNTFGYVGRPAGGKKTMGTMFDLSADLSLGSRTTMTFYAAGVRGGGVARSTYPLGGDNPLAHLFYIELSQRF
ncbi:MAG TPA: alginate export family protein [Blastocatellia bacterium]|nr:alginate export family protein [Blastocatellia bacterium]